MPSPLSRLQRSRGQATAEFLVAAPVVLALGLGALEMMHWHTVRQIVSHALQEAARAGAVAHAQPEPMRGALQPRLDTLVRDPPARSARLAAAHGLPAWEVEILSPDAAQFAQFGRADAQGRWHIPSTYLDARQASRQDPPGAPTWFDANVLHLRVTYLHAPSLPGLRWLLRQLPLDDSATALAQQGRTRAGLLPIVRDIAVTMQSDAWPSAGRFQALAVSPEAGHAPDAAEPTPGGETSPPAPPAGAAEDPVVTPTPPPTSETDGTPPLTPWSPPPDGTGTLPTPAPDDPACGVTLCCPAAAV